MRYNACVDKTFITKEIGRERDRGRDWDRETESERERQRDREGASGGGVEQKMLDGGVTEAVR